jgi:ABC-type multidrug transport system fused ATPase/permease subunit
MEYIKQFLYLLDAPAKKAIPILILAFLFSSLLDVIGVGLIGIFLGLLTNPQFIFQKFPYAAHFLPAHSEKNLIITAGILIAVAFAGKAVITLTIQTKIIFFCQSLSVRLKTRLMHAYQYAPYTYHLQKNSAYLISRIQENAGSFIGNVLLPLLNLVSSGLIALSILLFLSVLHPYITAFLLILFISVGMIFDLFVKRKLSSMGKIVAVSSGEMIKNIHHGLHGLAEIRVLGRENYFLNSLNKVSERYAYSSGVLVALQQIPRYLIENMIAIFIVGLSLSGIVAGYSMVSVLSMVGMFAAAGARLLPTVTQIMSTVNQIRGYSQQTTLVYEELTALEKMKDDTVARQLQIVQKGKLEFTCVALQDVHYQYPHTSQSAIKQINLTFYKGQSIGLIGPSGAGKSTLVNLLLGFLEPQQGTVLVDSKKIESLRAWLNNFAYIPQSIFLLDDTVRRNIALGIEDENIDDERLWAAIQMAQLTNVIQQLPQQLDTFIGENGIRLSGGQRQRIALARAFYHERDIIVMDEATSSLDNETESEVINTIKRLKGNKTLIVIAHRLTTVEHCDVLYRLEKGQITAMGSFDEVVRPVTY